MGAEGGGGWGLGVGGLFRRFDDSPSALSTLFISRNRNKAQAACMHSHTCARACIHTHVHACIPSLRSPRAPLSRGGDVAVYVSDIKQSSLPTSFYPALASVSVFMALSAVFHSTKTPNNSPLSHSVFPLLFCLIGPINYISLLKSLSALT